MAACLLTGGFLEVLGRALLGDPVGVFSITPNCKCSRMPIQTLKQSSHRLIPYLSRSSFLVSLQIGHFPVCMPIMWGVFL